MAEADEWIPVDYEDHEANPLPEPMMEVWVYDAMEERVTIGWWDDWWRVLGRKDDVDITHWRPLVIPEPPVNPLHS